MEENTVFQGTPQPGTSAEPVSQPSSATPLQASNPAQKTPTSLPSDGSSPLSFLSGISRSQILKIGIGIVAVIAILFLLLRFVIPLFFHKNEKITLTYWGLWEDERVMQSVIADFQKSNPLIEVKYSREDPKQYQERLTTRIRKENSGPDIFRFHNTWLLQISDILLPLPTDIMKKDEFQNEFYQVAQTDLTKNGAIYGIPLEIDTLSLFINPQVFQSAGIALPTTWDEFGKAARALTVKDENGRIKTAGAAMGTYENIAHASDIVSLLFVQNGADLKNLTVTSQNASDTLDFYTQFAKPDGNVWDDTLDNSILAFSKGNLAMCFGYSWDIFTIKTLNPKLSFQIIPVPHLPGRTMTIASYWAEGVSIKSKHKREALQLLKFLTRKETSQKLFTEEAKTRLFGEPYARTDLADSLKDSHLLYPFVSQAPDAVSSFFASDTHDNGLNTQMNGYLGDAVHAVLGNTSPQSAVETLAKGVSQVLKQYGQ